MKRTFGGFTRTSAKRQAAEGAIGPLSALATMWMVRAMWAASLTSALFITAWLAASAAPIALSFASWRLAKSVRFGWLVHLAFLPAVVANTWLALRLLMFAADGDGGGTAGYGVVILMQVVVLIATLASYYGVLVIRLTQRMQVRARRI